MPTLPTHQGSWGRFTPPVGVQIKWSHPLAHGLIWYVLGNEAVPVDLVSNNRGNFVNALPVHAPNNGGAVRFSQAANSALRYRPRMSLGGLPMSMATCLVADSWATSFRVFVDHRDTAGGSNNYVFLSGSTTSAAGTTLRTRRNTTVADRYGDYASGTSGLVTGRPQSLAVTWPTGQPVDPPTFYFDGQRDAAALSTNVTALAGDLATDSTTRDIYFGTADNAAVVRNLDGAVFYAAIWRRTLSPSEVELLNTDPYCFLVPA